MRRILPAIRRFFAQFFPPIEKPALPPLREQHANAMTSIVEDYIKGDYHGDSTKDDTGPDQGRKS